MLRVEHVKEGTRSAVREVDGSGVVVFPLRALLVVAGSVFATSADWAKRSGKSKLIRPAQSRRVDGSGGGGTGALDCPGRGI